ncbi:hypothetical protein CPB86DRAFT_870935 [Serendipita vermifera]|nr:hypothetical protein CPB86DRAFT_870935 [Serendipita vermifera]
MIFKNIFYMLLASTAVMAQSGCVNQACIAANNQYKECLSRRDYAAFKSCLCTKKFLINYERCLNGTVCAYDDTTSIQVCVPLYCPGKFDGGFDPKAFCGVSGPSTTAPATRETYIPTTTFAIETGPA